MNTPGPEPKPFEVFVFFGNENKCESAIADMNSRLPGILKNLAKEGRPMRMVGAPVIFQEDNFFKLLVTLWEDQGMMIMGMMKNIGDQVECDHSLGYDSDLKCLKCGMPI